MNEVLKSCPHLVVSYRRQQNYNYDNGKPEIRAAGWFCRWCDQRFVISAEELTDGLKG